MGSWAAGRWAVASSRTLVCIAVVTLLIGIGCGQRDNASDLTSSGRPAPSPAVFIQSDLTAIACGTLAESACGRYYSPEELREVDPCCPKLLQAWNDANVVAGFKANLDLDVTPGPTVRAGSVRVDLYLATHAEAVPNLLTAFEEYTRSKPGLAAWISEVTSIEEIDSADFGPHSFAILANGPASPRESALGIRYAWVIGNLILIVDGIAFTETDAGVPLAIEAIRRLATQVNVRAQSI